MFSCKRFLVVLLLPVTLQALGWQYQVLNNYQLPGDSGQFVQYEFSRPKQFPVTVYTTLLRQDKLDADIIVQNIEDRQLLMNLSDQNDIVVAINGGYYRENFLPNGLLKIDNQLMSKAVKNSLLEGAVTINQQENLDILDKLSGTQFHSGFQAGPLLYNGVKWLSSAKKKQRRRSVIIEFTDGDIMLVHTTAVTLNMVVDIIRFLLNNEFQSKKPEFVLNLDGGNAAAFVLNHPKEVVVLERDYIKTAVVFRLKNQTFLSK